MVVEAESVVGFINAYQHSGEKKFLESARSVWEYIKAEIIDKREGSEWYAEVSYDHKPHDWKEIVAHGSAHIITAECAWRS